MATVVQTLPIVIPNLDVKPNTVFVSVVRTLRKVNAQKDIVVVSTVIVEQPMHTVPLPMDAKPFTVNVQQPKP